ncbi:unnamed protein product [Phytophthora fragariaefolia]|uniref:Unnamed protein product n=1 Tax=Phytophthora fragariaefolia TaxID=1490495 RepID=A0A9W6XWV5_9STRA|nr:unnamed protein product [Phytophthora fragariaefolia]
MKSAELKKWRTAVSLDGTIYLWNTNQFSRIFMVPRRELLMHSVEGWTLNLKRRSSTIYSSQVSTRPATTEIRPTSDLIKSIIEGYKKDKVIQEIRRVIEKRSDDSTSQRVSGKQYKVYFVVDNLVWYQGSTDMKPRIVVPNILSLKHKIIAEIHDANYGGHPGTDPQEVATLFIDNIWRLHGTPQDIVSDRDTKFISGFWSQVFEDVGTKLKMTVAYRVQGDGQLSAPTCLEALDDDQAYMADVYDKGRKEQEFKVGDRVYLSTKNLDTAHTGFPNSHKLGPKWIGPYSVVRTVHKHAYELNLPPGLKLHPVFNTSSLKPYEQPNRLSR